MRTEKKRQRPAPKNRPAAPRVPTEAAPSAFDDPETQEILGPFADTMQMVKPLSQCLVNGMGHLRGEIFSNPDAENRRFIIDQTVGGRVIQTLAELQQIATVANNLLEDDLAYGFGTALHACLDKPEKAARVIGAMSKRVPGRDYPDEAPPIDVAPSLPAGFRIIKAEVLARKMLGLRVDDKTPAFTIDPETRTLTLDGGRQTVGDLPEGMDYIELGCTEFHGEYVGDAGAVAHLQGAWDAYITARAGLKAALAL